MDHVGVLFGPSHELWRYLSTGDSLSVSAVAQYPGWSCFAHSGALKLWDSEFFLAAEQVSKIAPRDIHASSSTSEGTAELWFSTAPLTALELEEYNQLQLVTESRDQGCANDNKVCFIGTLLSLFLTGVLFMILGWRTFGILYRNHFSAAQ